MLSDYLLCEYYGTDHLYVIPVTPECRMSLQDGRFLSIRYIRIAECEHSQQTWKRFCTGGCWGSNRLESLISTPPSYRQRSWDPQRWSDFPRFPSSSLSCLGLSFLVQTQAPVPVRNSAPLCCAGPCLWQRIKEHGDCQNGVAFLDLELRIAEMPLGSAYL